MILKYKDKYLSLPFIMLITIGFLLFLTVIDTMVTNPAISGYAVVDADTQDTERFTGMTTILILIFAVFGLFLFVITRKKENNRQ